LVRFADKFLEFLSQLTDRRVELNKQLTMTGAWRPLAKSPALSLVGLQPTAAQPIVLLFNLKSTSRVGSAIVVAEDQSLTGGVTLLNAY
jgi:hypothetical protein